MLDEKINIQSVIKFLENKKEKTLIHQLNNDQKITYSGFLKKSREFLYFLQNKKKLKSGDKIVIKLENSAEYLIAIFACFLGRFVACPIDKEMPDTKYKKIKKILNAKYEINNLKKIKYEKKNSLKYQEKNTNFLCLIIFTSGSTGEPKGIQIKLKQYLGSALEFGKLAEYDDGTNIYHCLPMHYNAGLLNTFFSGLLNGSKITIGPQVNMINLLKFWNNLSKSNIHSVHIVPEIANALLKLNIDRSTKDDVQKIDKIISTGSHLYEETKDKFEKKYQKRLLSCYGLTEIGGPITLQDWEDTFEENSVGKLINNISLKIIKKNNLNLIYVKTPYLFDSYLLENGKIQKPKTVNGYFNTNDIGIFKDENLFIYGRKKEIFKRGSEIVSPQDIENTCRKFKNVIDCAVLTEDNVSKGSKIYLLIEFKENIAAIKSLNSLRKFLEKNLKKIEFPDKILLVPKIFRTPSGKIKKNDMQKIYI
ncbi:acyl--CoA ligase [Candidatus Pelagibacter sp.]|nr:acyl--CoA ligase [Candidatus Pelagibacter sp.]